jgi:hypothetical protein
LRQVAGRRGDAVAVDAEPGATVDILATQRPHAEPDNLRALSTAIDESSPASRIGGVEYITGRPPTHAFRLSAA